MILSLLASDLAEASQDDMKSRLMTSTPSTARIREENLRKPLDLIVEAFPSAVRDGHLKRAQRQINIFALHGSRLDIREDNEQINAAMGEVLRALNITPISKRRAPTSARNCSCICLANLPQSLRPTQVSHQRSPKPGPVPINSTGAVHLRARSAGTVYHLDGSQCIRRAGRAADRKMVPV